MTRDPNDVVTVARGEHVQIELYRQRLAEAGIEARALGESLEASFGTAIPGSVELLVHRGDVTRAEEVIRELETGRRTEEEPERPTFPHPTDTVQKPHTGAHGPHTHYDADPRR